MAENIIINGVDVSGCDYFKNNGKCRMPHYQQNIKYTCCNCSEWNCYYKQLKRKEQELQQAMDNYVQLDLQRVKEYNELVDLYKAKEQECEDLKDLNTRLDNQRETYWKEYQKLQQTLAEIKEIAEREVKRAPDGETFARPEIKQILQKISDVMKDK